LCNHLLTLTNPIHTLFDQPKHWEICNIHSTPTMFRRSGKFSRYLFFKLFIACTMPDGL
jgi:hypothetical protein